ncbi:MlaD family protein [Nocardia sp. 2YAB30]|uniref:MlaD family protein n=1 Tax=unclassified Nocardia TaxID=2637762 RepID=UPI003F9C2A4B
MRVGKRVWYPVVGVAVLTVLFGLGSSAVTPLDRTSFGKIVCAEFTDTDGLYRGNDVTVLGVRAGIVDHIEPLADRVRVTMRLDRDVTLPADTSAVTMSGSIVTDRRVELIRSHTDGPELAADTCIPLSRTKTPLGVSESFDALGRLTADITGGVPGDTRAGDTLAGLDRALRDTGTTTNDLLAHLARLVGDPRDRDATMRRLIDNLDLLTTMFGANWPDMQLLLDHLYDGLEVVEGLSANFAPMVDLSNQLLPVLARNVDKYGDRVYTALDSAVPAVHAALQNAGGIRDLLSHLPPAVDALLGILLSNAPTTAVMSCPATADTPLTSTVCRHDEGTEPR